MNEFQAHVLNVCLLNVLLIWVVKLYLMTRVRYIYASLWHKLLHKFFLFHFDSQIPNNYVLDLLYIRYEFAAFKV